MVTLKALQQLAKEMQEGIGFDPPVNHKETSTVNITENIKNNAADLDPDQDQDAISDRGKKTLQELQCGPWFVPAQETEEVKEAEVVKPKKEKGVKVQKSKKPAPTKQTIKGVSRYGHRLDSMGAAIDELVYKGTTEAEAAKLLSKNFKRTVGAATTKFKVHVAHLQRTGRAKIKTNSNGVVKASK